MVGAFKPLTISANPSKDGRLKPSVTALLLRAKTHISVYLCYYSPQHARSHASSIWGGPRIWAAFIRVYDLKTFYF